MSLRKISADIANFLFVVYAFFVDIISVFPPYIRLGMWFLIIFLQAVSYNFVIRYEKKLAFVLVLTCCIALINNQEIIRGNLPYMMTLKFMITFLYFFLIIFDQSSYNKIMKTVISMGLINVIATYFFLLVPSAYAAMFNVWGYYPTGTQQGTHGYRAALTNHYSHNGIICIITTIALFAVLISDFQKQSKKKRRFIRYLVLFLLSLFAVVMTSKRGVLLFGVVAMMLVYSICNIQNIARNGIKIVIVAAVIVTLLYLGYRFIPIIHNTIDRFLVIGTEDDKEADSRFEFWKAAIKLFFQHPVFGIGWFGFRYYYNENLYDKSQRAERYSYMNAHNVYIQMLCESGAVGFIIYITLLIAVTVLVFRLIHRTYSMPGYPHKRQVIFGSSMHFLFVFYSLTGNCLYDMTFAFYCIALGFLLGTNNESRNYKKKLLEQKKRQNEIEMLDRSRFFVDS